MQAKVLGHTNRHAVTKSSKKHAKYLIVYSRNYPVITSASPLSHNFIIYVSMQVVKETDKSL